MRTEIIITNLRGFVVAATALAIFTQTAAAAPINTPSADSGSAGIHITTDPTLNDCQWTVGGSHDITTTFSSDGTISTNDQSPDAVSAKHRAMLTGPITAAGTLKATSLPSQVRTATDTIQPRPKSKFKKLIFAAAVLPIAAISLMMIKMRRSLAANDSQWGSGDMVAMPHPVAGIAMGHIDNRKDQSSYPSNHPWYA